MLSIWADNPLHVLDTDVGGLISRASIFCKPNYVTDVASLYTPSSGEVVLCMGGKCLDHLKAAGLVQKNRTLSWMRGRKIHSPGGGTYLMTYSLGMIAIEAKAEGEITWDIRLADRLEKNGSMKPKLGEYGYTTTLKYVREYVEQKYEETGGPVDIATDLETMGLWPWYDGKDIVSISFTVAPGTADVVYINDLTEEEFAAFLEDVEWLLNTSKVRLKLANGKFDMVWIAVKWGIECTNFSFDTLIVGSLIDENRSNSLNVHAKQYTDMGGYDDDFNAKHDKAHMENVPKNDLLVYAGGDTDACLRVANVLKSGLVQDGWLTDFYVKLLHPAARAFEKVERRGMYVDVEKYKALGAELEQRDKELAQALRDFLPAKIRAKHSHNLDMTRKAIISDFMFTPSGLNLKPLMVTEKSGQPSTSKVHLQMFEEHPEAGPFIKALNEWNSIQKTKGTYVDGFLEHLRPDGKFHPTYMLYSGQMYDIGNDEGGTVTGRTSAKNPAVQTLPKHTDWAKRLRECFPAPSGKVFFQCDYSQGELRITACIADEPNMLAAYDQGIDLHALTGAKLGGYEYGEFMELAKEDPEAFGVWRQRAKPANFGYVYGMSANGYLAYAKTYGIELELLAAEHDRNGFFDLYSRLLPWHDSSKNFARNNKYVRSPIGRIRHLPLIMSKDSKVRSHAERQAINSPVQATLSDMCQWAIAILEERFGDTDLEIIGMTHDSLYGYFNEDRVSYWIPEIENVMENLPLNELRWEPQLKFPVDSEVGPNMAKLSAVS